MDSALIITGQRQVSEPRLVEVCASFSYKLNMDTLIGPGTYESRDFFCSQKMQCPSEERAQTYRDLYDFCRASVMQSVREYSAEVKALLKARNEVQRKQAQRSA